MIAAAVRSRSGPRGPRVRADSSRVRFGPISQRRAHEYVVDQIRRHIALRLILPGQSLPSERELATMFGVGRPTVQHALRLLEADRLVDTRRGRHGGTFVVTPSEDRLVLNELIARVRREREELEETLVYRRALEPGVARVAAATRGTTDVKAMRSAAASAAAADSESEYMRSDTEFHLTLAAATGSRFVVQAMEEVRMRLSDLITLLPESDLWHQRIDEEHEALVAAIEARDEAAAAEAMSVHVTNAEQGMRAALAAVGRARRNEFREAGEAR